MLLNILTWTQSWTQMSWTCVGSVFRSPIKIFNNPIEPPSKVIFGPSLNVMQKKFLGSLVASFNAYGILSTNNNLDVFKLFFVSEVSWKKSNGIKEVSKLKVASMRTALWPTPSTSSNCSCYLKQAEGNQVLSSSVQYAKPCKLYTVHVQL